MAATLYKVPDQVITGTTESPETILFSAMTDIDGNAVPTTFQATPLVFIGGIQGDNVPRMISKSTTQIVVALSDHGLYLSSVTVEILIAGVPV